MINPKYWWVFVIVGLMMGVSVVVMPGFNPSNPAEKAALYITALLGVIILGYGLRLKKKD